MYKLAVPKNVLVFPAGTEIGLEIFNSLKYCKEVNVFGAGQNVSNHAKFAFPDYYDLPSIYDKNWESKLIDLCNFLKIDYIFPAYDDVIIALNDVANLLPAKVVSSSPRTCAISRSKSLTYETLCDVIRVPKLFKKAEDVDCFPVIVKPDKGQGAFGVTLVTELSVLYQVLNNTNDNIICEYLPGEEYTVDCFSDRVNGVMFVGSRVRNRIRNGIAVNTSTSNQLELKVFAQKIWEKLKFRGAWFFQVKRASSGELALLEVAPRIAGSMSTHRVCGINFPLLSIFEDMRIDISINKNKYDVELDRAFYNRYKHSIKYSTLYIDLDDTIILRNKLNLQAIKLIFQCRNNGKRVILITRHEGNIDKTLAEYRLSHLFDEIIKVSSNEKKSSFVTHDDAIFVDDSFSERLDVDNVIGIPTFDCSMIEIITEQAEYLN